MGSNSIAWLRNDLRIADNPALSAAVKAGDKAIAVYIHETTNGVRPPGGAARWWLEHSLDALGPALAERGVRLIIQSGDAQILLPGIVADVGANAVFWNRRYAPGERDADAAIMTRLKYDGIAVSSFAANLLVEPWDIATGQGKAYSVFTPFWKRLRDLPIATPMRRPSSGKPVAYKRHESDYRAPAWSPKLASHWATGEAAAHLRLVTFLDDELDDYAEGRDFPARQATSHLSPHLRFGEISARQVWHAAQAIAGSDHRRQAAVDKFLSELAWRDFNYHQLFHRHDIANQPMQPKFAALRWRHSEADLVAWQQGSTGIPLVDAGMRELWQTGFMQNRVRMLTASLLAKNLLIDWRLGEQWFWDCLVDADMANNPGNWQWVAGSGMDAAPYFRIFNPVTQGERFDEGGGYVRRWVPELAALPDNWIHRPAEAPADVLAQAGVTIGQTYPEPIVDLKASRARALEVAKGLKSQE